MAIAIETRFQGIEKLKRKMANAPRKLTKSLVQQGKEIGLKVVKESQRNAKYKDGQLESDITSKVEKKRGEVDVKVYVPKNARSGKYAFIQHFENKGRGPGTVARGSRAGWKFISRAIRDLRGWILKHYGKAFKAVT